MALLVCLCVCFFLSLLVWLFGGVCAFVCLCVCSFGCFVVSRLFVCSFACLLVCCVSRVAMCFRLLLGGGRVCVVSWFTISDYGTCSSS